MTPKNSSRPLRKVSAPPAAAAPPCCRLPRPLLLVAASLLLAGCSAGDAPRPQAAVAPGDGPATAVAGAATSSRTASTATIDDAASQVEARVLLDLRLPAAPTAIDPGLQARAKRLVYGDSAPGDVRLVAAHAGAFTVAGRRQHAVLLARGDGIGPAPAPPLLAVLDGDGVAAQFVPDPAYAAMPAAADIDGDGLDDLLLVTTGYQMGQSWEGIDVVSLADGRLDVVAQVTEARLDACEAPTGERTVGAAVVTLGSAGLRTERFVADCVPGGTPGPAAFRPAPAPR